MDAVVDFSELALDVPSEFALFFFFKPLKFLEQV
jgi:hypothetical protein